MENSGLYDYRASTFLIFFSSLHMEKSTLRSKKFQKTLILAFQKTLILAFEAISALSWQNWLFSRVF